MKPDQESRSALLTALIRAAHSRDDDDPIIDDSFGLEFTSDQERNAFRSRILEVFQRSGGQFDGDVSLAKLLRGLPGYGSVVFRTRYAEDCLAAALERGARQYVILGAGLDSFGLRHREREDSLKIFEIDHPASQDMKRQRLAKAGLHPPGNVTFIPVDFEHESLAQALAGSDFDPAAPSFFSCLGVTPYLTKNAIQETVRTLAEISDADTELVFNYVTDSPPSRRPSAPESPEPIVSRFGRSEVRELLQDFGFAAVEDLGPGELVERYGARRRDGLRPAQNFRIVHARNSTAAARLPAASEPEEGNTAMGSSNLPFRPIYVCGSMRSGTTILQKLICLSPDSNDFAPAARYLMEQIRIYTQFAEADSLYVTDYLGDGEDFRAFTKDLVARLLTSAWSIAGEPTALVLKNPELSYLVPDAQDVLGDSARFVFSVREPKDTITSMIRVGKRQRADGLSTMLSQSHRDIDALCRVYNNAYLPLLRNLESKDSTLRGRVQFVRYEDLVTDPAFVQGRVCEFCGIESADIPDDGNWPSSESVAQIAEHRRWRTYMTELSSGAVSDSSVGSHKALLSAKECARIDQNCGALRELFKYG